MSDDHKVGALAIVCVTIAVLVAMIFGFATSEHNGDRAHNIRIARIHACKDADNVDACLAKID